MAVVGVVAFLTRGDECSVGVTISTGIHHTVTIYNLGGEKENQSDSLAFHFPIILLDVEERTDSKG